MTFSCVGFFCSVFPLGLSYDPYAGTLTKRGTWENVSRALEVVCLCVCSSVCVCGWKSVLTTDIACSAYLPCALPSRACVLSAYLRTLSIQAIWRDAAYEDICVTPVNLFKGTQVFDIVWNPQSPLRFWYMSLVIWPPHTLGSFMSAPKMPLTDLPAVLWKSLIHYLSHSLSLQFDFDVFFWSHKGPFSSISTLKLHQGWFLGFIPGQTFTMCKHTPRTPPHTHWSICLSYLVNITHPPQRLLHISHSDSYIKAVKTWRIWSDKVSTKKKQMLWKQGSCIFWCCEMTANFSVISHRVHVPLLPIRSCNWQRFYTFRMFSNELAGCWW